MCNLKTTWNFLKKVFLFNYISDYQKIHTSGRNLKQRTNVRPRKRIKAPKYINGQHTGAQKKMMVFYIVKFRIILLLLWAMRNISV